MDTDKIEEVNGGDAEDIYNYTEDDPIYNFDLETVNFSEVEADTIANTDETIQEEYTQEMKDIQEIQRTFSNVMRDYEGDSSAEIMFEEYKKLYEQLKNAHVKQKKLVFENSSLRCEIKNNADKVNLAIHLAQEDKEIIRNLTTQVHQAWNEAEVMSDKEARARAVIVKLQDEISQLTALVENGLGVQELQNVAHQAVSERKELEECLVAMKAEMMFRELKLQEVHEKMQQKDDGFKKEMSNMAQTLKASDKRFNELQKKMQEMEDQCRMLERVRVNLTTENANSVLELENSKVKLAKFEKDEADLRTEVTKLTQTHTENMELLSDKSKEMTKLLSDLDINKKRINNLHQTTGMLKEKLDQRDQSAKMCERNLKKRDAEVDVMTTKNNQTSQAIKDLIQQLCQREDKLKTEKEIVHSLHMTLNDAQTRLKKVQLDADEFKRSADFSKQTNLTLTNMKFALEKTVELKEKTNVSLIQELNGLSQLLKKAINTVATLESDKERLYGRINTVLEMVNSLAADNENKEAKLLMLLKVNNEQESHLVNINTKLFRMTNQRDNISNELHLIQLKNDELNLANMNFSKQSTSLAEDLHHKEHDLDKKAGENSTLRNEIRSLENDVIQWQDEVHKKQVKINDLEALVRNMDKTLCHKEQLVGKLRLVLDQMVNQRNLLGYQCLKKKEQIQLLTEKNKLMQNIFNNGNRAFNFQNKIIDQMKINTKNLMRQKNSLMYKIENIENFRSKLGLANQQLVGALARSLAMEGEHPFNLHRWRHLRAVDISQYEMVIKIQYLLKRVITKTDEVTHLESVILDKTAVVNEMKRILERRPGLDIVVKAKVDRDAREDLSKKLKAAVAERNMSLTKLEHQASKNRHLVERMSDEKRKSIMLNKHNIKLKSKMAKLPSIGTPFATMPSTFKK